jgi:hypothetical protein
VRRSLRRTFGAYLFAGHPPASRVDRERLRPCPCEIGTGVHRALSSDVLASNPLTMSFVLAGLAAVQVLVAALFTRLGK